MSRRLEELLKKRECSSAVQFAYREERISRIDWFSRVRSWFNQDEKKELRKRVSLINLNLIKAEKRNKNSSALFSLYLLFYRDFLLIIVEFILLNSLSCLLIKISKFYSSNSSLNNSFQLNSELTLYRDLAMRWLTRRALLSDSENFKKKQIGKIAGW